MNRPADCVHAALTEPLLRRLHKKASGFGIVDALECAEKADFGIVKLVEGMVDIRNRPSDGFPASSSARNSS
jgi:hypothetical protein